MLHIVQWLVLLALCVLLLSIFMVGKLLLNKSSKSLTLKWAGVLLSMSVVIVAYFMPTTIPWDAPMEDTTIRFVGDDIHYSLEPTVEREQFMETFSTIAFSRPFFTASSSGESFSDGYTSTNVSIISDEKSLSLTCIIEIETGKITQIQTEDGYYVKNPDKLQDFLLPYLNR